MSALTRANDVLFQASGLPDEDWFRSDPDLIEETVLGLRAELDAAERERSRLADLVLSLGGALEQAEAAGGDA